MKFNSAIAASILAFCGAASAWTEADHGLYVREAGLLDDTYYYDDYELYSREAEPEAYAEPEYDQDFDVDALHPRDAYEHGFYMGLLEARGTGPKTANVKNLAAASQKADLLKGIENKQKDNIAKSQKDVKDSKKDLKQTLQSEKTATGSRSDLLKGIENKQRENIKNSQKDVDASKKDLKQTQASEKANNANINKMAKKLGRRGFYYYE